MAELYGYIRVSTREQNEDRQLVAMRDFGVADNNIFLDKQSGKDFERVAYRLLLKKLKPGDISETGPSRVNRLRWERIRIGL